MTKRLDEAPRFVSRNGEDESVHLAWSRRCAILDRKCLRYLRGHWREARRAIPDDPDYWRIYRSAVAASVPSERPEDVSLGNPQRLIEAAKYWPMHRLLRDGRLTAETVHADFVGHRRLLSQAPFLIDKMIFVATAAISMESVNVLMAELGDRVTAAQDRLIDQMLAPLSLPERSLRRVLEGERRYGRWVMDQGAVSEVDPEQIWRVQGRVFGYLSDRSELPWRAFWAEGMDVAGDVPGLGSLALVTTPSYSDYARNLRMLDAQLYILRALREVYAGRASPGVPGIAPPGLWHWRWDEAAGQLCLDPGYVHTSLSDQDPVCVEYLTAADVR